MNPILDTLVFLVAIRFIGIKRIFQFWPWGTLSNNRDNFESLIVKSWQTFFCEDVKSKDILYKWWARGGGNFPVRGLLSRDMSPAGKPRRESPEKSCPGPISVPVIVQRDSSNSGHERKVQILCSGPGPKCRGRRPGTGPEAYPGTLALHWFRLLSKFAPLQIVKPIEQFVKIEEVQ